MDGVEEERYDGDGLFVRSDALVTVYTSKSRYNVVKSGYIREL